MKNLSESLRDALKVSESQSEEVFVVKDKEDGTIITVCDTEAAAKEAASENKDYEVTKGKRSDYVK